ncbi:MAG: hypothetical protein HQ504_03070 [Rhodospirillaceae bacterium]|nr:hypothetical protein [Rhodospirillaceae bacterium]
MIILDYFLLNEPQWATAGFVLLFYVLSALAGRGLGRSLVEGSAFGFLILAASANLSLFIFRPLGIPTAFFGFSVIIFTAVIVWILRRVVFPKAAEKESFDQFYAAVVAVMVLILWAGNILHPFPDAGFSSHHGWIPPYMETSFEAGHFLLIDEMGFGTGLMTSFYYVTDLMGMVALGMWLGAAKAYPVFNAGSILGAMLAFSVLMRALKHNRLALLAFFVMSLVMFRYDLFFRVMLGGNLSDVIMYLSGALVLYYLVRGPGFMTALLGATAASIFLVFSRHYGAFLSGVVMITCFATAWFHGRKRDLKPWFILGFLLVAFSLREIYYIVTQPTPYYPGTWNLGRTSFSFSDLFLGALTDWGILTGSKLNSLNIDWKNIYLIGLLGLAATQGKKIWRQHRRFLVYLAPLLVLVAPLVLQMVTGYRTSPSHNKSYIFGALFFAWYPCYLFGFIVPVKYWSERIATHKSALAFVAVLLVVPLGYSLGDKLQASRIIEQGPGQYLQWAFHKDIVDREIAERLLEAKGQEITDRPVMYFYYEPGITLRHYLGGEFFKDFDFWSDPVLEQSESSATLYELLARFGYPNLYLSIGGKSRYVEFLADSRRKYAEEIKNIERMPWVERIIEYKNARFVVVKKPDSK